MTRSRTASAETPTLRVRGPADLLQAVPYLLGFHPQASLVLVGLDGERLVVTVRVDLLDLDDPKVLADALDAMVCGGAERLVAAVYDDAAVELGAAGVDWAELPWRAVADDVHRQAARAGGDVVEVLLVAGGRWWSYCCGLAECCPPEGRMLPSGPSVVAAEATYAGMVALPDRASLAAVLEPRPRVERDQLADLVAAAEDATVQAVLQGGAGRHERSVKRALFAAARAADTPGAVGEPILDDAAIARFGVALSGYPVRDSVWMAIDDGRIDGRELWRSLAARLPGPYDAAPLFLFAWATWRDGNGALARIAAERAIESDPGYSAADLLLAALQRGVDPRRLPRLRLPRSA